MSLDLRNPPPWLATVLLAEDDTEESVMGSDLHQAAIGEFHASLYEYAEALAASGVPPWYVSTQVTVIVSLPERERPWQPKPDVFVVQGVEAHPRTSYDTRTEGPMPPFILEVASESTWRYDVGEKAVLYGAVGVQEYLVFDPTTTFLGSSLRGWHRTVDGWVPWLPVESKDGQQLWHSTLLGLTFHAEGLLLRVDHPERGTLPIRRDLRRQISRLEQELLAARAELERLRDSPGT